MPKYAQPPKPAELPKPVQGALGADAGSLSQEEVNCLINLLLQEANKLGIRGGSAFKAMAGFGRHHNLHEAHFFELAGSLAVEIEFIVTDEEAKRLLALIHTEKIRLFYAHIPARFGVINPDAADPPAVEYGE